MSENTTENTSVQTEIKGTYDWREEMRKAGVLKDRAATNNKAAGERLWKAAQAGINEWLPNASDDTNGEHLYAEFITAYGETRKGDCSKMRAVALAVKNNGLVLANFPNLSKAYAEAKRLTTTTAKHAVEDEAIEAATAAIAGIGLAVGDTPEHAAMLVLAKGPDEAARLLLDALGKDNDNAHRAFLRAVSNEIAGRVKPKVSTVKAGPKEGAKQVTATVTPKAKPVAQTKAKPVVKKAETESTEPEKAEPEKAEPEIKSVSKGDPNRKALPPRKAVPVKAAPVKAAPAGEVKRATPVVRRPVVKRGA